MVADRKYSNGNNKINFDSLFGNQSCPYTPKEFEGETSAMMIDYMILGKNIKYYRKLKRLTQEQLAEQLDLSLGFISQVERGVTKMSLDTLIDLCDSLDCSAGDILDNAQAGSSNKQTNDFLALYERLPQRDQALFYHMLKAYVDHLP